MVGDVLRVGLFVFAFVESMTSVFGVEGPNLPELRVSMRAAYKRHGQPSDLHLTV